MPKYPITDQLIDVENNEEIIIERNNQCCNNKNVCIMLSTSLCIVLLVSGLTLINIYALHIEDGSL
jgi:hypothetical protein